MNMMSKIKLLQKALNTRGQNICIYTTQHMFIDKGNLCLNQWHIKQATPIENSKNYSYKEIFNSFKMLDILLFLRDMWCNLTGESYEVDEEWEARKRERLEKMAAFKGEY